MTSPATPFPRAPGRVVIGATAHAELAAWIHERRPGLEIKGARHADVTPELLDWGEAYVGFKRPPGGSLGAIRWVHCTGAGVDAWLWPDEIDSAVLLTRTSESFGPMIAEWALARMLAFTQQLLDLATAQHRAWWAPRDVERLAGTSALVAGMGDVGRAITRRLVAFDVEVTGLSRSGRNDVPGLRAVYPVSALADVVPLCDWLVLAVPHTRETEGLVSRAVLSRCRGAVLLNAGRGAVVDEDAIPTALAEGWLRGAALDVFREEPLPASSALWHERNVMISPHISGITTLAGAGTGFLECLADLERGVLPRGAVDRARGY